MLSIPIYVSGFSTEQSGLTFICPSHALFLLPCVCVIEREQVDMMTQLQQRLSKAKEKMYYFHSKIENK